MDIHIAVEGRHDLAGQIYRQLRAGIVEGRLTGGTRLPSTRDLATQLGVSRKTTLDVFERLLAEGYLSARSGSGSMATALAAPCTSPYRFAAPALMEKSSISSLSRNPVPGAITPAPNAPLIV